MNKKNLLDMWNVMKGDSPLLNSAPYINDSTIPDNIKISNTGTSIADLNKIKSISSKDMMLGVADKWQNKTWKAVGNNDDIIAYILLITSLLVKKQIITEEEIKESLRDVKRLVDLSKSYYNKDDADDTLHKMVLEKTIGLSKELINEIINL